jgi:hypothetical protein
MTRNPDFRFHQTAALLRRVAARGGRSSARNRRARLRTASIRRGGRFLRRRRSPRPPPPPSPPWMPSFPGCVGLAGACIPGCVPRLANSTSSY